MNVKRLKISAIVLFLVSMSLCLYANGDYVNAASPPFTISSPQLAVLARDNPIGSGSVYGVKSILEINFPVPIDLSDKTVQLKAKGPGNGETVNIILLDDHTRRSPDFYMGSIEKEWKVFSINIEEIAFDFVDTSHVQTIKIKLLSPLDSNKTGDRMVLIKEIEVI